MFVDRDDEKDVDACILKMMKVTEGLYIEALRASTPEIVRKAVAQAIPKAKG